MAKKRSHKQNEHLKGVIKALTAENKRLKKETRDKDEIEYEKDGSEIGTKLIDCVFCKNGFMQEIYVVGRNFYQCLDCGRTKKK